MIHKITTSVDFNWWLKYLTLNLMKQQIQIILKYPSQRIRNRYYKTFGTYAINSPMFPSFHEKYTLVCFSRGSG